MNQTGNPALQKIHEKFIFMYVTAFTNQYTCRWQIKSLCMYFILFSKNPSIHIRSPTAIDHWAPAFHGDKKGLHAKTSQLEIHTHLHQGSQGGLVGYTLKFIISDLGVTPTQGNSQKKEHHRDHYISCLWQQAENREVQGSIPGLNKPGLAL